MCVYLPPIRLEAEEFKLQKSNDVIETTVTQHNKILLSFHGGFIHGYVEVVMLLG